MYPISGYPKITEFRAMLAALAPDSPTRRWEGGHFLGYVAASEDGEGKDYWFRGHHNGIAFGLSVKVWKSGQALFREAGELLELRLAWESQTLVCGER